LKRLGFTSTKKSTGKETKKSIHTPSGKKIEYPSMKGETHVDKLTCNQINKKSKKQEKYEREILRVKKASEDGDRTQPNQNND
jgi:hypothetical protein